MNDHPRAPTDEPSGPRVWTRSPNLVRVNPQDSPPPFRGVHLDEGAWPSVSEFTGAESLALQALSEGCLTESALVRRLDQGGISKSSTRAALLSLASVGHVSSNEGYCTAPALPQWLAGIVVSPTPWVRSIRQGDVTLVHNTERLDPSILPDNPLLALAPAYAAYWGEMDGKRSLADVHAAVTARYSWPASPSALVAFLEHLRVCRLVDLSRRIEIDAEAKDTPSAMWDIGAPRAQKLLERFELPFYVVTEVTHNCNASCPNCYAQFPRKEREPCDTRYLGQVVDSVVSAGITYVAILGGEPLLRPDLVVRAVERYRQAHVYTKLVTNGLLLDEALVERLDAAGINRVELSLDACTSSLDARLRSPGLFDAVLRAISIIRESGIPQVALSITVSSANLGHLISELPDFVSRHPVHKVYFSPFYRPQGCHGAERELTREEMGRLIDSCAEWEAILGATVPGFEAVVLDTDCPCGRSTVAVTPQGRLKHCPRTDVVDCANTLGGAYTLREIWLGQASNSPRNVFAHIGGDDGTGCLSRRWRDGGPPGAG